MGETWFPPCKKKGAHGETWFPRAKAAGVGFEPTRRVNA